MMGVSTQVAESPLGASDPGSAGSSPGALTPALPSRPENRDVQSWWDN